MTDRPIIFSAPMVRALLAGRKTQTRRLASSPLARCAAGDRLWVREAWACHWATDDQKPRDIDPALWSVRYLADDVIRPASCDGSTALLEQCRRGRPSIFMPRWASRVTLVVEAVRVEQLQAIGEKDAEAEGCVKLRATGRAVEQQGDQHFGTVWPTCRAWYADLWDSLHPVGQRWDDGPAVTALTFRVVRGNIDQVEI